MTLPPRFSELEPFVGQWDRPDFNSRYRQRLVSSMDDMKVFYSAMLEQAEAIKSYLDELEFAEYSDADKCLARLMFAFSIVAGAVEIYRQPRVPDSGATSFDMVAEPDLA